MRADLQRLSKLSVAVVSHKVCWPAMKSPSGYATDGGFPMQMAALSELFREMKLVVPVSNVNTSNGILPLSGNCMSVVPLAVPEQSGIVRKLLFPVWLAKNASTVWRSVKAADAVHTPIPGDVGTIGLLFALAQRKPLFVRHCGNWNVQRTVAERFWRRMIETFAGGRNVMLATGGSDHLPSEKNPNVGWVFASSLRRSDLNAGSRELPSDGRLRLITVCRQEKRKGADVVVKSLPLVLQRFPMARLDVVGGGSLLGEIQGTARELGVVDRITFHGQIRQPHVMKLLKKAHAFCYPTSASEGFPKVVLEALACGLPVISTRVSVIPRLLRGGSGVIIDRADETHLAAAIRDICDDPATYRRMSERAVETARQYSLENWRDVIGETLARAWTALPRSSAEAG